LDTNILVPVLVALIGALGAYIAAVRKLSGSVSTSTAEDLWEESRSIRQDYQQRIMELNRVVDACRTRLEAVEERNATLSLKNGELKRLVEDHSLTIATLRETVLHLEKDNTELREENVRLRRRVTELEEA
jgi:chromosome segregation ATPase